VLNVSNFGPCAHSHHNRETYGLRVNMRHVWMKPSHGCLQLKVLEAIRKKVTTHTRTPWCITWCVPSATNSLGYHMNHCTTSSCTSLPNLQVQTLWDLTLMARFNDPKMWNLNGDVFEVYVRWWALPVAWYSAVPALCGPHGSRHCHSAL